MFINIFYIIITIIIIQKKWVIDVYLLFMIYEKTKK
jgi:hypothetical protein